VNAAYLPTYVRRREDLEYSCRVGFARFRPARCPRHHAGIGPISRLDDCRVFGLVGDESMGEPDGFLYVRRWRCPFPQAGVSGIAGSIVSTAGLTVLAPMAV